MDEGLIKFIVDLGSIGAIVFIVYLFVKFTIEQSKINSDERIETHRKFCESIEKITERAVKDDD